MWYSVPVSMSYKLCILVYIHPYIESATALSDNSKTKRKNESDLTC